MTRAEWRPCECGLTRREVIPFDESDSQTPTGGIDSNSSSGSSTPNDHQVEFTLSTFLRSLEFIQHLRPRRRGPSGAQSIGIGSDGLGLLEPQRARSEVERGGIGRIFLRCGRTGVGVNGDGGRSGERREEQTATRQSTSQTREHFGRNQKEMLCRKCSFISLGIWPARRVMQYPSG